MKRIECIIMDWAGSAVDYGCFAPVAAFLKAFNEIGINITMEQARRPMGMAKIDHIRELFKMDGVGEEFEKLYHRPWNEQDVTDMNAKFEEYLFASLANYTDPIPGVIDTLNELRKQGIKIGSTTGYTQAMMDVVLPNAARKGYTTDKCVTPNGLPAGRPFPYMIYQNMIDLAIPSTDCVLNHCRHQRGYQCQSLDRRCHTRQQRTGTNPGGSRTNVSRNAHCPESRSQTAHASGRRPLCGGQHRRASQNHRTYQS